MDEFPISEEELKRIREEAERRYRDEQAQQEAAAQREQQDESQSPDRAGQTPLDIKAAKEAIDYLFPDPEKALAFVKAMQGEPGGASGDSDPVAEAPSVPLLHRIAYPLVGGVVGSVPVPLLTILGPRLDAAAWCVVGLLAGAVAGWVQASVTGMVWSFFAEGQAVPRYAAIVCGVLYAGFAAIVLSRSAPGHTTQAELLVWGGSSGALAGAFAAWYVLRRRTALMANRLEQKRRSRGGLNARPEAL